MSFLSGLAKIGGFALAPFTGGASIPIGQAVGDMLGGVGQVSGNDAGAAAQGRLQQAQVQQGQDRNAIELYRQKLLDALNTPGKLASNAVRGDVISNAQPASFSGLPSYIHVPQMSGGLTPASLGPGSRQAGAQLTRTALQNLMSNQFNIPKAPELTPLPQSSGYDAASKWLGRIGGFAGAAVPYLNANGQPGHVAGEQFAPEDLFQRPEELDPTQFPGYSAGAY